MSENRSDVSEDIDVSDTLDSTSDTNLESSDSNEDILFSATDSEELMTNFSTTSSDDYLDSVSEEEFESETPFIDDVLTVVFSFLKNRDLYKQAWVCKQFRRVSLGEHLWKERVEKFQLPILFEKRNSIKNMIIKAGKPPEEPEENHLPYRHIYLQLQNPFGHSKKYIMKLNKYKECDVTSDTLQVLFPCICFLILLFSIFLIVLKMKGIGTEKYPISIIGAVVSIFLLLVFLCIEIFYILRILQYYKIGSMTNRYFKFQSNLELGETEKLHIFHQYLHYYSRYHRYPYILIKIWGDYGIWKSLPFFFMIYFLYDKLESIGLLVFLVGLMVSFQILTNFVRFMLMNRFFGNCIFDEALWNMKYKEKFRLFHCWRSYRLVAEFLCAEVSGLALYMQFFLYILNQRGHFQKHGDFYVFLPPLCNLVVVSALFLIAVIYGVLVEVKNDLKEFYAIAEFANTTSCLYYVEATFYFHFYVVKKVLYVSSDYAPFILTPTMMFIFFLQYNSLAWIIIVPIVTVCCWGVTTCLKNFSYSCNKMIALSSDFNENVT